MATYIIIGGRDSSKCRRRFSECEQSARRQARSPPLPFYRSEKSQQEKRSGAPPRRGEVITDRPLIGHGIVRRASSPLRRTALLRWTPESVVMVNGLRTGQVSSCPTQLRESPDRTDCPWHRRNTVQAWWSRPSYEATPSPQERDFVNTCADEIKDKRANQTKQLKLPLGEKKRKRQGDTRKC